MAKEPSSPRQQVSPIHSEKNIKSGGGSFSSPPLGVDDLLRNLSPVITAVLVDAAFFIKRARVIVGQQTSEECAKTLHKMALSHLTDGNRQARLYRIFVYDAPPADWKGHSPLTKKAVNFADSPTAQWRHEFHHKLRGMRKVALRMGYVSTAHAQWQLNPGVLKDLTNGKRTWSDIKDEDFRLDVRQKGVDMRLGLDIATLAFKRQVNQIVLISGDADFVPAAKLARREGIDFILDPMWQTIHDDLHEHIDGLRTKLEKPMKRPEAEGGGVGFPTSSLLLPFVFLLIRLFLM